MNNVNNNKSYFDALIIIYINTSSLQREITTVPYDLYSVYFSLPYNGESFITEEPVGTERFRFEEGFLYIYIYIFFLYLLIKVNMDFKKKTF
jgi:hypothetical protein